MPLIIQTYLIRYILSPIGTLVKSWSTPRRQRVFSICLLGIFLVNFWYYRDGGTTRFLVFLAVYCVLISIMILAGLTPSLQPRKSSRPMMICWFGTSLLMVLSGLRLNPDYLADGMLFLVVLPVFWLVWGQFDYRKMVAGITWAVEWAFFIFVIIAALFYPIPAKQYWAFFGNTNPMAIYLLTAFCCFLFEILTQPVSGWKRVVKYLGFGTSFALIFYTNSRGGQLGCLVAVVGSSVLLLAMHRISWKILLRRLVLLVTAAIVAVVCVIYVFYAGYSAGQAVRELVFQESVQEEITIQTPEGEKPPEGSQTPSDQPTTTPDLQGIVEFNGDRISADGKTSLDDYTSGRMDLWSLYSQELNLLGNDNREPLYWPDGRPIELSAHLTVLQLGYQAGVPAAIFYLLFNLLTGIYSILFFKRQKTLTALFPFLITITFGSLSLMESMFSPLAGMLSFMYYMVQSPIVMQQGLPSEKLDN